MSAVRFTSPSIRLVACMKLSRRNEGPVELRSSEKNSMSTMQSGISNVPPEPSIRQLSLHEITDTHMMWLCRVLKLEYNGYGWGPKVMLESFVSGSRQLWSLGNGVLITQTHHHPAGKELFIWGIAGEGIVRKYREIYEALKEYALENGMRWIGGYAPKEGIIKLTTRKLGAIHVNSTLVKEL